MSAFFGDALLIWRHGLHYRVPKAWKSAAIFAMLAFFPVWGIYHLILHNLALEIGIATAWSCATALCYFWFRLVRGMIALNTPSCARLVPRIWRSIKTMTWCGFLFLTALLTALTSATIGHTDICFVLSALSVLMIGPGSLVRGASLLFNVLFVGFLARAYLPHWLTDFIAGPYLVWLAGPFLLWAAHVSIASVLSRDASHIARVKQAAEAQTRQFTEVVSLDSVNEHAPRPLFSRALRQAQRSRSQESLMLFALGVSSNWRSAPTRFFWLCAQLALPVLLLRYAIDDSSGVINALGWIIFSFFSVPWQFISTERLMQRVRLTPGEQALYRLTPAAPTVPEINRKLGAALLGYCLRDWLMMVLAIVIATWVIGATRETLLAQAEACCIGLPAVSLIIRDYARDRKAMRLGAVSTLASLTVLIATLILRYRIDLGVFHLFGILCVVITVVTLALRWRTMTKAAPAFPAGRLS